MRFDGREHHGRLKWDPPPSVETVAKILSANIGQKLRAIGALDIDAEESRPHVGPSPTRLAAAYPCPRRVHSACLCHMAVPHIWLSTGRGEGGELLNGDGPLGVVHKKSLVSEMVMRDEVGIPPSVNFLLALIKA